MQRQPAAISIACLLTLGVLAAPFPALASRPDRVATPAAVHRAEKRAVAHRSAFRVAVERRHALRHLHGHVVRLGQRLHHGVSLRPLHLSWRAAPLRREGRYWHAAAVRVRRELRAERRAVALRGAHAVAVARSFVGVPYSYGGASRTGVDCSGLTMLVYGALGVQLDHSSYAQWGEGRRVNPAALRPGDLVFFDRRGHVGVYAGAGRFIHAPHSGTTVRVDTLGAPGYGIEGAVRP